MKVTDYRFRLLVVVTLIGFLAAMGLMTPDQTEAGPLAGITVTPTSDTDSTPTPNPESTPTPDKPGGGGGDKEDHYVEVGLDCNLICSVDGSVLTVSADVRLIHQGSGWIAETKASNQGSSRVTVPYGGTWEVWLISPPEISPMDGLDASAMNIPTDLPLLLGTVVADSGRQLVDCPANCPPPVVEVVEEEAPPILPKTGSGLSLQEVMALIMVVVIIVLVVGGFQASQRAGNAKNQRRR